jgi:hypothetical protein
VGSIAAQVPAHVLSPAWNGSTPPLVLSDQDRHLLEVVLRPYAATSATFLDLTVPACLDDREFCVPFNIGDSVQFPDSTELLVTMRARNIASWSVGKLDIQLPVMTGGVRFLRALRTPAEFAVLFQGVERMISVSAPAFTVNGQRALVYVESRCVSGSCVDRSLILLERDGASWTQRKLL